MEALIAGDRSEFARLVDLYSSSIYRLGLRMLGNPQDAEDALNLTETNVKTRLLRARMFLREALSTYYSECIIR